MKWQLLVTAMLPEHILLAGIVAVVVMALASEDRRGVRALSLAAVALSSAAAAWLHFTGAATSPFPGQFAIDPAITAAKSIVLALSVPVLMMSRDDFDTDDRFYILLLSSLYGFCLLLSADSFLTLFLGLELMSLPVYVLVLIAFTRPESVEAALKYLVLGGAASATLLMGISLLFGASGTMALTSFTRALGSHDTMAVMGVALVTIAFFLKAAIVPFHAWAPDAYEGASIPVTAYMSTAIKAGALLAAARLFSTAVVPWQAAALIAILPLISIVWGNLTAMKQVSFRRMIAYSSIAHAGYLFYAFLGDGPGRFQSVVFYLLAYGLMNLLAFSAIPPGDEATRDRLENLKGLWHREPYAALAIGMAMLSLAGIPPFPGFIAKFLIFKNVIAAGYTTYAVLGLVGSYLGIYFYLRVIQFMFMSPQEAVAGGAAPRRVAVAASVACLIPVVLLALFPGWVLGLF
jgi:NADH-quinone oxidoreductase subunit N